MGVPPRIGATQDEGADALRVPDGVGDADRRPLRHPQKHESIEPEVVDERLEVADHGLERQVRYVPIREAGPPLVIPDQRSVTRQLGEKVAPNRAVPVELEVAQPMSSPDDWWTGALAGVREANAIHRREEPQLLIRR